MKKAIIIGATSGIGQEVAKCLLLDGCCLLYTSDAADE